jgi:DNA-binding transcriptional MerR regulator
MPINPDSLTPKEVSDLLSVSSQTIRRYSREFADHLSPDANPAPGGHRRYTREDVEILRVARRYLLADSSATYERVNLELESIVFPTLPPDIESPQTPQDTPQGVFSLALAPESIQTAQAIVETVTALTDHVEGLADAIKTAEQDRARINATATRQLWALIIMVGVIGVSLLIYLFMFAR